MIYYYQMLILITAVLFYFIGRYSGREVEVVKEAAKTIQKRLTKVHPGTIKFLSPKEREYKGSEAEKIDRDMVEKARSAGMIP